MPAFCPLCATDDFTSEGSTEDGTRYATCADPSHGEVGFTWEPSPPPGSWPRSSGPQGGGLGAELEIWDKLLECVPAGDYYTAFGVVEDEFIARFPTEAQLLLERYGHRWRDPAHRSGNYSMSVYLSSRLRELDKEGLLDVKWGPAEGPWAYNGIISYWRRHTDAAGELLTTTAAAESLVAPVVVSPIDSPEGDVAKIAAAAARLAPAREDYTEDDFVLNLMLTVLDYQMQTVAVENSVAHYKDNRWDELRTLDDVERELDRYPDDQEGNTALAQHLWGNRHWRRAHELRGLTAYFRSIAVTDQPALERWAEQAEFDRDFKGQVKGLGQAIFQWLIMRQGIDTVKPDVHVHRFAAAAVGRSMSDQEVVDLVTQAAAQLGIPARELDYRIWEASREG